MDPNDRNLTFSLLENVSRSLRETLRKDPGLPEIPTQDFM